MHVLALVVGLLLATAATVPKSAVIVGSKENFGSDPIGNVKVTFTDGHAEMWTFQGKASTPKVSSSSLVGWKSYKARGYRDYPVFDTLRVCWPDEHHRDYKADSTYPFIEDWAFVEGDSALILKSRAAHGPADFLKYDLATGKVLGHAHGFENLPDWAKPFADN